jgi:hypothetical protein
MLKCGFMNDHTLNCRLQEISLEMVKYFLLHNDPPSIVGAQVSSIAIICKASLDTTLEVAT